MMPNFSKDTDKWFDVIVNYRKKGVYNLQLDNMYQLSKRPPTDSIFRLFAETSQEIKIPEVRTAIYTKFIAPIFQYDPYKKEFKNRKSMIKEIFSLYRQAYTYHDTDESKNILEAKKVLPVSDNATNIIERQYGKYRLVTYNVAMTRDRGTEYGIAVFRGNSELPMINSTFSTKEARNKHLRSNIFPAIQATVKESMNEAIESTWKIMADILAQLFLGDRDQAIRRLSTNDTLQLNVNLSNAEYNRMFKNLYNKFLTLLKAELGTLVEKEDNADSIPTLSEMILKYMKDAPDLTEGYIFRGLKDDILPAITFEDLITTLESNTDKFDAKTVRSTYNELVKIATIDSYHVLTNRMNDILKHLKSE